MKKVIFNYKQGTIGLEEVPVPVCPRNSILVRNRSSLISVGTEKSIIELGRRNLLGKARERPDLLQRFIDKSKREGYLKTFREAIERLDNPVPLGYSSAGEVVEVGGDVRAFSPGDRVSCVGAGYASHAEYITITENLCCSIKESLSYDEASFGMLGVIALHGIRCANVTFGERVAVIGLGLLGLLTAQILKAYGCEVIATDIDRTKLDIAEKMGIGNVFDSEDGFKEGARRITGGDGADAVLITAATKSDAPVNTAVAISRAGGRVVLVGTADIHPDRNVMWEREIKITVSRAGGPGSLDPLYEQKGHDFPVGQVRWTLKRNLEEFLRLVTIGMVDVKSLISHRFDIGQAESVYRDLTENRGGPYIGVVFQYDAAEREAKVRIAGERVVDLVPSGQRITRTGEGDISAGVIGAGLFGKAIFLPHLKNVRGIRLEIVATSSGHSSLHVGEKYGFKKCTTDYKEVTGSDDVDCVFILTPHRTHKEMVIEGIRNGKHVFVEKPLCVNEEQLREIVTTFTELREKGPLPFLMVGYNRRFSPHVDRIRQWLKGRVDPAVIHYRVNAGYVPPEHWVHAPEEGGSRVVGEVCHFVDSMQSILGSNPVRVYGERVSGNNRTTLSSDNVTIGIKFDDGSLGNIVYTASGDRAFSRERIEVYWEGKTAVSEDFRKTTLFSGGKKERFTTRNQQIGHREELNHFVDVVRGDSAAALSLEEIVLSTLSVFKIHESIERKKPVEVDLNRL